MNAPNNPWQKSSFSGGGDGAECVEVATTGNVSALREGDEPDASLVATPEALAAFIRHLKRSR